MSVFSARILLDSLASNSFRLTSWELTYPRFIHSELMTHRDFSRNASSSRAIPVAKMIERIEENPAHPIWWGKNQSGMQAKEELDRKEKEAVQQEWHLAMQDAIRHARVMHELGAHKQIVNRILEPFTLITTLVTATNFENFFSLRYHTDAQPEFGYLAKLMADLYYNTEPRVVHVGWWHLPFIQNDEWDQFPLNVLRQVSVARCARVSYLTHVGKRDIQKDLELHDQLLTGSGHGHWSPFEHVAQAQYTARSSGNFFGWEQYRKQFHNERQETFNYDYAKNHYQMASEP